MPGQSDADLLEIEFATLWAVGAARSLVPRAAAPQPPAPLVAVASSAEETRTAFAPQVPRAIRLAVEKIVASMQPSATPGWELSATAEIVRMLARVYRVGPAWSGPSYVVDGAIDVPAVRAVTSADTDPAQLAGRMPEDDRRALIAPWAAVIADDAVAAVCETARSTPAAVEAGVWTYDGHHRKGHATAATAAWAAMVVDRTAFYSTTWDNLGSQGVARRLGLRPIGQIWRVMPGAAG